MNISKRMRLILHLFLLLSISAASSIATYHFFIRGDKIVEAGIPKKVWEALSSRDKAKIFNHLLNVGQEHAYGKVNLVVHDEGDYYLISVTGKLNKNEISNKAEDKSNQEDHQRTQRGKNFDVDIFEKELTQKGVKKI